MTGAAHAACVALVIVDMTARAVRLRGMVRVVGGDATLHACAVSNGAADLVAALTPMRVGGLPAHAAALAAGGVETTRSWAALGVEAIVSYLVVALLAAGLMAWAGGDWAASALPALARAAAERPALIAALVAACVLALVAARLLAARLPRAIAGLRRALEAARVGLSPTALAAVAVLTAIQVGARVAILPVLAAGADPTADTGVVALGSFALLYGQLVTPTPSGAGVVDAAALAGLAGPLGPDGVGLLAWWRAYTVLGGPLAAAVLVVVERRVTARSRRV